MRQYIFLLFAFTMYAPLAFTCTNQGDPAFTDDYANVAQQYKILLNTTSETLRQKERRLAELGEPSFDGSRSESFLLRQSYIATKSYLNEEIKQLESKKKCYDLVARAFENLLRYQNSITELRGSARTGLDLQSRFYEWRLLLRKRAADLDMALGAARNRIADAFTNLAITTPLSGVYPEQILRYATLIRNQFEGRFTDAQDLDKFAAQWREVLKRVRQEQSPDVARDLEMYLNSAINYARSKLRA